MTQKIDKDTAEVEVTGNAIKGLVGSQGWAEARMRLIKKVAQLKSISNIDIVNSDAATIIQVIAAKNAAAEILVNWLKDIEGSAEQYTANASLIEKEMEGMVLVQE